MRLAGLLIIIILVMGSVGYWYYQDSQTTISVLNENNSRLKTATQIQEQTISKLQADYQAAQKENKRLNDAYEKIRRQNSILSEKLNDVDLGLLATEKPDLIERAINNGTNNAGRCFEILSGSPLTEQEKSANTAEEFNKECPWLWPGKTEEAE